MGMYRKYLYTPVRYRVCRLAKQAAPGGVGSKGLQKMRSEKPQDSYAYAPRAIRADRAAAYLDISKSKFLELVTRGRLPKPVRIDGITSWDRLDIDVAYESMKEQEEQRRNPIEAHYGIGDE